MAIDKYKGYANIQQHYRLEFLLLQKRLEKEYASISNELSGRIKAIIDRHADANGHIRKTDLEAVERELDEAAIWFSSQCGEWINRNVKNSIDLSVLGHDTAAQYFVKRVATEYGVALGTIKDLQAKLLLGQQYGAGLVASLRKQVWTKRWDDGFNLSDRLWVVGSDMRTNLHSMIQQCVNQGMSAVEFSRSVEEYLTKPGASWTTGIKPSVTGRGSVDYNALRLARTETNNAYRAAQDLGAQNSAIVKGIKWSLSNSHPKKDICDTWATQDMFGLGPGVYKPGKLPPGHPNCLCYLTDVLFEGEELVEVLKSKYSQGTGGKNGINSATNTSKHGIINNATGAIPSDNIKKRNSHAKRYYEEIRKRKTDIKAIARNTGWKESAIQEIKEYVFVEKHMLDGKMQRFYPDYDQAIAWQRLIEGKNIKENDLVLLKHEYVELTQTRLHGYSYEEAHSIANKRHNWQQLIEGGE